MENNNKSNEGFVTVAEDGYYQYHPEKDPIVKYGVISAMVAMIFVFGAMIKNANDGHELNVEILKKELQIIEQRIKKLEKSKSLTNPTKQQSI